LISHKKTPGAGFGDNAAQLNECIDRQINGFGKSLEG